MGIKGTSYDRGLAMNDHGKVFFYVADSNEEAEELKLLKSIINVFMLRRTKDALVANKTLDLPSFSEITM